MRNLVLIALFAFVALTLTGMTVMVPDGDCAGSVMIHSNLINPKENNWFTVLAVYQMANYCDYCIHDVTWTASYSYTYGEGEEEGWYEFDTASLPVWTNYLFLLPNHLEGRKLKVTIDVECVWAGPPACPWHVQDSKEWPIGS